MIIIDTNVYSAANRGNTTAINAMKQSTGIIVPTIVIGELRAGFLGGSKNELNKKLLEKFISDDRIEIATCTLRTTDYYAQLFSFCKKSGKSLSNNDLWIAAIALENNCKLVTYDKDFKIFSELLNNNLLILSN